MNIKRIKLKWIVIGGIVILVVLGIYLNPDRKTEKVNAGLGQIITSMNATMQQVKQAIIENKVCFTDESLKT
ncbi:MAG: hypothetical protein NT116_02890 [Candidatus Parcubacteria bacterium]|nr:hypothetical protein [Candidatus Parcubacteria bacterium]